jgi:phospho-N-acetylmuramoyl-pentapeptide-transferase
MAPIHHHFEMSGWSEVKIVTVFTCVTIVFSIAGVAWLAYMIK